MKKTLKPVLAVILIFVLVGGAAAGFFIWRHHERFIEKDEALEIALGHAGLSRAELIDMDVDFDSSRSSAWYDIDFETHGMDYEYTVDAASGEILYSHSEPEHAD